LPAIFQLGGRAWSFTSAFRPFTTSARVWTVILALPFSKLDPIVAKILKLRNEFIAHRSINVVATHRTNLLPAITNDEVNIVLDLLYDLSTKYAMLYGHNKTSRFMVGCDDYKSLFAALRKGYDLGEI
jgi:hypothetical protein